MKDFGKLKCKFTGHELNPGRPEDFQVYINENQKYLKAFDIHKYNFDYENFCRFIIPHKHFPETKMFCAITQKIINKDPREIILHYNGKGYLHSIH